MTTTSGSGEARAQTSAVSDIGEAHAPMSTASRINERIAAGIAVALTLEELCERGCSLSGDVDLITLAFPAAISGSAAMFVFPIAGRGVFTRAEHIHVNRVPGHAGPAPNERLGVVDTLIFADERSLEAGSRYDGASLFLDLLQGRVAEAECHSVDGTIHHNSFDLKAVEFARFYVYNAPLPAGAAKLKGLREALVPGTRIALNGSQGIVVGSGTRDRPDSMALSITADMHDMDAALMVSDTGRPRHVVACPVVARDAGTLGELVEWAGTAARESLFCAPALKAASGLQRMIREGRFQLAETGAVGAIEMGRPAWC